jgi:hypothetical protein
MNKTHPVLLIGILAFGCKSPDTGNQSSGWTVSVLSSSVRLDPSSNLIFGPKSIGNLDVWSFDSQKWDEARIAMGKMISEALAKYYLRNSLRPSCDPFVSPCVLKRLNKISYLN